MSVDYSKWDEMIVSDEESDDAARVSFMSSKVEVKDTPNLYTIPWNSFCEKARWALEKHGIAYLERDYPWGWHLLETAKFFTTKELTEKDADGNYPSIFNVPILRVNDSNIFKRNVTVILMFCYARAFSVCSWRIFWPDQCLSLDQMFDTELGNAVNLFYLDILTRWKSSQYAKKVLEKAIYLPRTRALTVLAWPVICMAVRYLYGFNRECVRREIREKIKNSFDHANELLTERMQREGIKSVHRVPSLCKEATTWNACDLSFACHAQWVLFPQEDQDAKHMGFRCFPCISSEYQVDSDCHLYVEEFEFIRGLQQSLAGTYANSVLKRERFVKAAEDRLRLKPSKYETLQNQSWITFITKDQNLGIFGSLALVFLNVSFIIFFVFLSLSGFVGSGAFVASILGAIMLILSFYWGNKVYDWWQMKGQDLWGKTNISWKNLK